MRATITIIIVVLVIFVLLAIFVPNFRNWVGDAMEGADWDSDDSSDGDD